MDNGNGSGSGDGSRSARSTSFTGKKRSSPPSTPVGRSRPHSPSPGPVSTNQYNGLNGSVSVASSSALTSRNVNAVSRSGYATAPSGEYEYGTASTYGGNGITASDSPPGLTVDLTSSASGDVQQQQQPLYAYSTTLRRQPSIEQGLFPRSNSRDRGQGSFRNRASSNPYGNTQMGDLNEELGRSRDPTFIEKALSFGRRLVGRDDPQYDPLQDRDRDEDSSIRDRNARQKDTPSSIFAHKSVDDTIRAFSTHPSEGLSSAALPGLLARYGMNEFQVAASEPLWLKLAKQVYEQPLILMLLGSSVVSAIFGSYDDAICVLLAVGIVLTVAFIQEQRSEKSLEALNKLVPHFCHLIRNGQSLSPLANALLPGDLVTFSVGDRIPADIRLVTAVSLEIDESALTGETRPSKKNIEMCEKGEGEDTHGEGGGKALGERHCMAFMGTLVRSGHGSGIVVGTGKDTEFGVVFEMMQDVEEQKTPLQIAMDDLAKRLSFFSFAVIGVIFLIGVLQHRGWLEMFTIGVSLAVAAIPEGLPIVTTVTLALGVLRMSKRKAIVKKLPSVEALGSVSVICSDKTGTLTKNEMTVTQMYAFDDLLDLTPYIHSSPAFGPRPPSHPSLNLSPAIAKSALVGNLCNNSFRNEQGVFVGQATEVALLNVLPILNLDDERKNFVRKNEIPFSSDTKTMIVSGSLDGGSEMIYMKGAVEAILAKCRYYYVNDTSTPSLDTKAKETITARALESARKGLRLIATAYGFAPKESSTTASGEVKDLIFCGFQAIVDPPRKGVAHAIASLHSAGVQMVMITGDAEPTALAIARDLGMKVAPPTSNANANGSDLKLTGTASSPSCMLGSQVDQLSERELIERVPSITVYARTTPRHKMAIVRAWQMRGAIVAMTGDGVNDSPALKMADIGISMGKSGTDVAKEAADVILVDDDFSSILPAVEEGKSIFYNIQNFLSFQLSTAVAALSLITLSTLFKLANPLNAMQILFINILMDGPPAQALGVDPVHKEIMRRPPRRKDEPVLSRRLMYRVGFSAGMMVLGTLFVYIYEVGDGSLSKRDQTMTFTTFVFLDLISALQNRGLFTPLAGNRILLLTLSISFLAQLSLIYIPLLQHIFQTQALGLRDLGVLICLAGVSFGGHEVRRRWERVKEREGMGRGMVEGLV